MATARATPTETASESSENFSEMEKIADEWKNWDPMGEDFADWEINTYEENTPGGNLRKQQAAMLKNGMVNYKIYVGNVPLELKESGLRNIFNGAGIVRDVVRKFRGRSNKCFALLEFSDIKECYEAIKLFHRAPPHSFYVKFADIDQVSTAQIRKAQQISNEIYHQSIRGIPQSFLPSNPVLATVTFCKDPQDIWLQLEPNKDIAGEICVLLTKVSKEPLEAIEEGDFCIAPFQGTWNRALVEGVDLPHVWVLFIDYGNRAKLNVSDLKILPENLYSQSRQAICVGLAGLADGLESWFPGNSEKFDGLLINHDTLLLWKVENTGKEVRGVAQVRLSNQEGVINEKLASIFPNVELDLEQYSITETNISAPVKDDLSLVAKTTGPIWYFSLSCIPLEVQSYAAILVGAREPPLLCVQLSTPQVQRTLEFLRAEMVPCQFKPPLARIPKVDEVLGACFVERQWCRVRVRKADPENRLADVVCIDYSHQGRFKFDELRDLPEKAGKRQMGLHHVQVLGFPDHFQNSAPAKELLEKYVGQTFQMGVVKVGNPPTVTLVNTESNIALKKELFGVMQPGGAPGSPSPLVGNLEPRQFMYGESTVAVPTKKGEKLKLLVLEVESPTWIMMTLSDEELLTRFAELNDEINVAFPNNEAEKPYVPIEGEVVLAYSNQGQAWIRAACMCVESSRPEEVLLICVDLGNLETVMTKCLRPMEERFMGVPLLATHCVLEGYETREDAKVDVALKKLLPLHETVEAAILGEINGALLIDIPRITEQLTEMGLF